MSEELQEPILGLVFDMDGLIFDSERVVQRTWDYAGELLGYEHFGEHIYNTIGFNVVRRGEYFRTHVSETFPMEEFTQITRNRYHEIVEAEGLPIKPGVVELLTYAKERDLQVALATSSRRVHATDLLQRFGLIDYFDGAVFGDMVTNGKPSPEIYVKACREIGIPCRNAVALEDAPSGIRSAVSAGMRAIMVPDLVQPDESILKLTWHCCDSLLEVLKLL